MSHLGQIVTDGVRQYRILANGTRAHLVEPPAELRHEILDDARQLRLHQIKLKKRLPNE
jgi:hypothetical protein